MFSRRGWTRPLWPRIRQTTAHPGVALTYTIPPPTYPIPPRLPKRQAPLASPLAGPTATLYQPRPTLYPTLHSAAAQACTLGSSSTVVPAGSVGSAHAPEKFLSSQRGTGDTAPLNNFFHFTYPGVSPGPPPGSLCTLRRTFGASHAARGSRATFDFPQNSFVWQNKEIDSRPPHGQTILHAFLTTHPGPSWPTLYLDLTYPTPLLNSQNDLVVPAYPIPGLAYPRLLESNSKRRDSFRRDLPAPRLPYTSALSSLDISAYPAPSLISSPNTTKPSRPTLYPSSQSNKHVPACPMPLSHPQNDQAQPAYPIPTLSSQTNQVRPAYPLPLLPLPNHQHIPAYPAPLLFTPTQPRLAEHTLGKSRRRTAYPQQIVTTRLLYCLQDRFAQLSRLQRI